MALCFSGSLLGLFNNLFLARRFYGLRYVILARVTLFGEDDGGRRNMCANDSWPRAKKLLDACSRERKNVQFGEEKSGRLRCEYSVPSTYVHENEHCPDCLSSHCMRQEVRRASFPRSFSSLRNAEVSREFRSEIASALAKKRIEMLFFFHSTTTPS